MSSVEDIRSFVDEHWAEIQQDIADMVAIDSVRDDKTSFKHAPYGAGPRKALDEVGKIAARLGMEVHPCDDYCCVADLPGKSNKEIAIVAHVDVVPAGPGWTYNPFEVNEREGYLFGRGVEDDKGPGIIGLWAGYYFKKNGIVPEHKIRYIFGSDEESGMGAVKKYVAENPQPDFMFTPDAEFPVICGEKGIFQADAVLPFPTEESKVLSLNGGVATNAVAGMCEAVVAQELSALPEAERIQLEDAGNGHTKIVAHGISGHASMPDGTISAIDVMMKYLKHAGILGDRDHDWAQFMFKFVDDTQGIKFGVDCSEAFLGALTCVGGKVKLTDTGHLVVSIDIRYPTTTTAHEIEHTFDELVRSIGGSLVIGHVEHAHLVDPKDPCVSALVSAYSEVTGKNAQPIAIGGGTYAKRFKHSVAFGPVEMDEVKPEWAGNMHGPDEAISIEQLKQALVIYILSLEKLFEIDL